jgi:uncharacterized protein (TIGR00266 family)
MPTRKVKRHSKKMTKKNNPAALVSIGPNTYKGNKLIPKYEIHNEPHSASVNFLLDKDETILAQGGSMSYMDSDIDIKTSMRGVMKGLKRLFTTTSSFIPAYTAKNNKCKISFASFLPGNIVPIIIKPGDKITLASYGLVCMTGNVELETRMRIKGIFLGENAFLTDVKVDPKKSNNAGMVWVASYGGYEKMDIPSGKSMMVDNGMFLAARSTVKYEMSKIGGVKSAFFSGEGIAMKFNGPCSLLIQNRNMNDLTNFVSAASQSSGKAKGLGGVVGAFFD